MGFWDFYGIFLFVNRKWRWCCRFYEFFGIFVVIFSWCIIIVRGFNIILVGLIFIFFVEDVKIYVYVVYEVICLMVVINCKVLSLILKVKVFCKYDGLVI